MIRDLNDVPVTSTSVLVAPGGATTFSQLVDCRTNYVVTADVANDDVTIEAKFSGGVYADIVATPLDTTAFNGQRKEVFFRISIAGGADPAADVIDLQVRRG